MTQAELDEVARKLNDRPRQTLGFRNPADKLTELIEGSARALPSADLASGLRPSLNSARTG